MGFENVASCVSFCGACAFVICIVLCCVDASGLVGWWVVVVAIYLGNLVLVPAMLVW
jgi:hypothetical protein